MKPVQLILPAFALAWLALASSARAQTTPAADAEPAATAPAPPPAPQPASAPAAPPAADLPPPPPPRGNPPPPPQGKLVISAPPVPPPQQRAGYKTHDGFYLRMALGLGGGSLKVKTDSNAANDFSFGGGGLALNVWAGGTPWSGVTLGGLLYAQLVSDSNTKVAGRTTSEKVDGSISLLGPFIDAFPDPLRGLHVGGSLGFGRIIAQGNGNVLENTFLVKDFEAVGLGGSAWVGYMGWVGPQWSMGGLLQLTALRAQEDKDDIKRVGSGYSVSLSFSALYH